ncbi:endospore germination permease [Clostridium sp. OS1-26]|uniref:GerAB/ArcD/ProY family transporter n=1 Tax=Clostridium sp. OS1-26 TaxID=3070681 RepID=UPI0027DF0DFF|nr:endospore germination permease [Clostridium sp. OS1-26]WML33820.1 endospore germination permease [Clostridium sp. OS1-26]
MNKEVITDKQGICLVIMFILGSTLLIGTGSIAENDTWLSIIIGTLLSIPVIMIYSRLLYLFPGKDLFDILYIVFGNIIGKILSIIYIWFSFYLGVLVLRNFSEFTNIIIYPDTPIVVPMIFFILLCIFAIKLGIEVLGRWSEIFIIANIIAVILVAIILSSTQMEINNLLPVLYNGIKPVISGAFSALSFPFAETIVFTMVFSSFENRKSSYKIYFYGLIIGALILFINSLQNILVLGSDTMIINYFPTYISLSIIRLGTFIERMEATVIIVLIINVFTKATLDMLATCRGIAKLLNIDDYRFLATPIALLTLVFSMFNFKSTMDMTNWAFKVWPYYAIPHQVILPVIILIAAEIKVRKLPSSNIHKI